MKAIPKDEWILILRMPTGLGREFIVSCSKSDHPVTVREIEGLREYLAVAAKYLIEPKERCPRMNSDSLQCQLELNHKDIHRHGSMGWWYEPQEGKPRPPIEVEMKARHRRYKKVKANNWEQPCPRNYKMVCCDCGLVHWVDFRVYRGRAQMRVRRAEGLTQQLRKIERTLILKLPKHMTKGIRYSKKMGKG